MKKIILQTFLILAVLPLPVASAERITWSDEKGFTLEYPADWKRVPSDSFCIRRVIKYQGDALPGSPCANSPEEITITQDAPGRISMQEEADIWYKELKDHYTNKKISRPYTHFHISKPRTLQEAQSACEYFDYRYDPGDCKGSIHYILFFYLNGKDYWVMSCKTYEERFKEYSKIFFELAKSCDKGA